MLNDTSVTLTTTAADAIARARSLGQGIFLALEGARDERIGLAVGSVVHAMLNELAVAEETLITRRLLK